MDTLSLLKLMEQLQQRTPGSDQNGSGVASNDGGSKRSRAAREEAGLREKIVQMINEGKRGALKPNSGTAVSIGEHCVCVTLQEDAHAGYCTWEWHGHLLLFDEEDGYTPEFVYGNYFQPTGKQGDSENAVVANGIGLGGLIDGEDRRITQGSIVHRTVNINGSLPVSNGVERQEFCKVSNDFATDFGSL